MVMFDGDNPEMQHAYEKAQASFRYFWRELSWERRRIIPGLDLAMVKLPFSNGPKIAGKSDGSSEFEHMWIDGIGFDGDSLSGTLMNDPFEVTSVAKGDVVSMPFAHLTDWMMAANGRAYGGFTVNVMRSTMSRRERDEHDRQWGLDFGDPADVRVEITRDAKPKGGFVGGLFGKGSRSPVVVDESFRDHPMCVNMIPKIEQQFQTDRTMARTISDDGWTLLHQEALAGNLGVVKLLIEYGADCTALTPNGYTAVRLAEKIEWREIADHINKCANGIGT
jgi:uncharacterized protein YegJ (DUF2314 family)